MKKKVLLLNPPGRKGIIREYYCGHLSKGSYMWLPLDLLVLSGVLYDHCEIKVIDAMVLGLSLEESFKAIENFNPEVVVSLVTAVSWGDDMSFLKRVKELHNCRILVSGDYSKAYPKKVLLENEYLDAAILDFTNCGIVDYIEKGNENSKNIVTRDSAQSEVVEEKEGFSYAYPRHELFPVEKYHLPHILNHPYTTLLTSFGCMYSCTYCPFERINFKVRNMQNLEEELQHIKSLGIKELFFRDQCFGAHRDHAFQVCDLIKKIDFPFSWSTEIRVDSANKELLSAMKEAGCHTVMYGVESASENVLKKHNKNITLAQMREAFSLSKEVGLRTLAHVMMGMDGEDIVSQERLIEFCLELDPQYVSFNITAPLWNTTFREQLEAEGRIIDSKIEVDHSFETPVWESEILTAKQVCEMTDKAIRRFYLRPSYMMREFLGAKSSYQRSMLFREGINMLFPRRR